MQNVLVTGGAGFIGSNFIHYLMNVEPDIKIINFDALTYAGNLENLIDVSERRQYTFIQGDICDADLMVQVFDNITLTPSFILPPSHTWTAPSLDPVSSFEPILTERLPSWRRHEYSGFRIKACSELSVLPSHLHR